MMLERARPLRFAIAWIGAAVLLLPLSVLTWTGIGVIYSVSVLLFSEIGLPELLRTALGYGSVASLVAAMGWSIGALQQLVTRRYLQFELRRWREISALAGLAAGAVSGVACLEACVFSDINLLWVQPSLRPVDGLLLSMALFLGIFSAIQFLTLRRQTVASWLWVIAHLVSVPMVYALWQNPLAEYFERMESYIGVIVITPLVAGLVTGAVMLRIVSLSTAGDKIKRKAQETHAAANASRESSAC